MGINGRLQRYLLPASIMALLLFLSSFWLPQIAMGDCETSWHPCLSFNFYRPTPETPVIPHPGGVQSGGQHDKIAVIRELAQQEKVDHEKRSPAEGHSGLQTPPSGLQGPAAYRSVRSMVESELQRGLVNFNVRTRSGCRNLLRLHRSLLWILLLLQGLGEGPDAQGAYRTPGELCRDAYTVALAPHHPWLIRRAAELVFVALPDRRVFLDIVCVRKEEEVGPVLNTVLNVMREVYTRTQSMLEEHNMMELP
ncbi:unnamed protein product [Coregonus sp. 'balchen']|nr:unnamed protein product [Coregonus sp. 'balchen']